MGLLNDKIVLITGAASGIGKSIAEKSLEEGAFIAVVDQFYDGLSSAKDSFNKYDTEKIIFLKADVSHPKEVEKTIQKTVDHFGKLDIIVNNAGIGGEINPTGEMSNKGFEKTIQINLLGVFYGSKYAIKQFEKQKSGGVILNMASILGAVGFRNSAAYVAAKHGVVGLTKTTALEYADKKIRVNAIGPAFINTPLLDALDEANKQQLVALHPMGRLGEAMEVAELAVWLISEKASFITGSYYPIDGGYLSQ